MNLFRFGYMSHNVFKLDGGVIKLNVDTGEHILKKLPDGLFPTEPIFVPSPEATEEDDGVIVMSGIDGGKQKGFVIIYNATNMEVLLHATAPKKTLFGVHSRFFSFTDGCSKDDCTPALAASTIATTSTTASGTTASGTTASGTTASGTTPSSSGPLLPSLLLLMVSLALGYNSGCH